MSFFHPKPSCSLLARSRVKVSAASPSLTPFQLHWLPGCSLHRPSMFQTECLRCASSAWNTVLTQNHSHPIQLFCSRVISAQRSLKQLYWESAPPTTDSFTRWWQVTSSLGHLPFPTSVLYMRPPPACKLPHTRPGLFSSAPSTVPRKNPHGPTGHRDKLPLLGVL